MCTLFVTIMVWAPEDKVPISCPQPKGITHHSGNQCQYCARAPWELYSNRPIKKYLSQNLKNNR